MIYDNTRYDEYQQWCKRTKRPCLITSSGILSMGTHHYRPDGMLYIGRRKKPVGPYMVVVNTGDSQILVRHSELQNIHRVEQARWNVLQHIGDKLVVKSKKNLALLKRLVKNERLIAKRNDVWFELVVKGDGVSKTTINTDDLDVLDRLALETSSQEVNNAVLEYLKISDLFGKYWCLSHRIEQLLDNMFNKARGPNHDPYRNDTVEYIVNGRTYIISGNLQRHFSNVTATWPSPLNKRLDLDASVSG